LEFRRVLFRSSIVMPAAAPACALRLAAAWSAGSAACDVTEGDASLAEVVRGHFQRDFVAGQNTNVVLAHFATGVSDYGVPVIKRYTEAGVGQYLGDETAHFNQFLFSHR